jgi:hypothetical protein
VVARPVGTRRTLKLSESATQASRGSSWLAATALGRLNRALLPMPLALPLCVPVAPPPAIVVTTPAGVTARSLLLPYSTTRISPEGATARPQGPPKRAAVPMPLTVPHCVPEDPPPANMVTVPPGVTRLRRQVVRSDT